jgi:dihydroorotate dehydrogenase electron transfer subunit
MTHMKQFVSTVISNRKIAEGYYEMTFGWPFDAGDPVPGQFCTIRVTDASTPLLRRPFAFSAFADNMASIIYQKRGPATEILAARERGEEIDVIGPLGNTFTSDLQTDQHLLVAGGIGLGPMAFWARELARSKAGVRLVFGCRSANVVPDMARLKIDTIDICTDDGTKGFRGTSVDFLKTLALPGERTAIYCCGPAPMLKACHDFGQEHGMVCYVSMEQIMACGVGACMGCVVKVKREPGYARVCKEGPVFDSRQILWT